MKVLIIVEKTKTGYSAYSPDIGGCVATGATRRQVERRMRSALAFHLQGSGDDGDKPPRLQTYATYVDVAA
jgi:predicted RNase H-like HicB family nuclease